jgi:hypothetical protein
MYPTSSAQAAEAVSKHPPSTISNRLRSIASPGGPKTHRALNTLIGPAKAFVKGYEGSRFTNSNSQLAPVQSAEISCPLHNLASAQRGSFDPGDRRSRRKLRS